MKVSPLEVLGLDHMPAWVEQDYRWVMTAEAQAQQRRAKALKARGRKRR